MAQVRFTAAAEAQLLRLDRSNAQRVLAKLRWLPADGAKKLFEKQ